jgi:hypothetical protein
MSQLRTKGSRVDRYAYKRMITGVNWYRAKNMIIRFLTLTGVDNGEGYRKNFDKLRRVLRNRFGQFEYFAVRTCEGTSGVLHLLYVGRSFKWGELSKLWKSLTGYWNVSISRVKDFYGIGLEMTRQHKMARYSQSRGWFRNKIRTENVWFEGTSLMSIKEVLH